ncbi:hypothetical protein FIBSPDRAFT_927241, partial [Athelia psychrophila]
MCDITRTAIQLQCLYACVSECGRWLVVQKCPQGRPGVMLQTRPRGKDGGGSQQRLRRGKNERTTWLATMSSYRTTHHRHQPTATHLRGEHKENCAHISGREADVRSSKLEVDWTSLGAAAVPSTLDAGPWAVQRNNITDVDGVDGMNQWHGPTCSQALPAQKAAATAALRAIAVDGYDLPSGAHVPVFLELLLDHEHN